ncbi:DNA-methyltransferase [Pseudoduganella chitinolytica]|uniref:Methyltransferase n=1 Tax=Pseudoduganella chitinolytica TaxID=34070 RepID=A0ABY8B874_9BURK|nr:site-specific DNA-methyltransferase [Pseudoduganella chitinolytica]WEF32132.1 site-specific DNA-methyltransferase [Pseudoduganella chitinolytica]
MKTKGADVAEEPSGVELGSDPPGLTPGPAFGVASSAPAPWLDQVYCEDALTGLSRIPDGSVDLLLTDPPYNLGKDYGNASDQQSVEEYLQWTERWIDAVLPKLKDNGSLYIFTTWRFSPEIFVMLKKRMTMMNEIIWDRRVPSMGGSVRSYSSVHDTIGFFVRRKDYYFDLDAVRIPYDAETKKARSRSIFVGAKWLELGYNPKDLWSVSRLHREHAERVDHPTQKPLQIIERMIKASCPPDGVVLDLFMGSGTTAVAARRTGRHFVGFELNAEYCRITAERLAKLAAPDDAGPGSDPQPRPRTKGRTARKGSDPRVTPLGESATVDNLLE